MNIDAENLLDEYIAQKVKLLQKAGAASTIDVERSRELNRERMGRMADLVSDWHFDAKIIMEAAFAYALSKKHQEGPMPNMLYSEKYLVNALSYYLQVPAQVVRERKGLSLFLERRDDEYERFKEELERAGVEDLSTATSYPPEMRYVMSREKRCWDDVYFLSQETLEVAMADGKADAWLEHRGFSYAKIGKMFNTLHSRYQQV